MTAAKESRLTVVRHGPSAYVHTGGWLDAAGVERWRAANDEAGVLADAAPPPDLVQAADAADLIVTSDLQRAVESAERLAPDRPIVQSPLLRETALPAPKWLPLQWPVPIWEAVMHAQWGYRMLRGAEASPEELKRAGSAASWLTKLSDESESIVVVTHGMFRRLLAQRLQMRGWHAHPGRHAYDPWSVWEFRRAH